MSPLEVTRELLANAAETWTTPSENRLDAVITPQHLLASVQRLTDARWGYLAAITGLDHGEHLEVLYHFCEGADVLTMRVQVPSDRAELISVSALIPYATVFERELSEMFGITLCNARDTTPLFLPDDWDPTVYPLRKDADLEGSSQ